MLDAARAALLLMRRAYQKVVDAFIDLLMGQAYRKSQQLHRDEDLIRAMAASVGEFDSETEDDGIA